MSIIVFIILGGLVGWIASHLMGRREGVIASVIIGIVGSFIGSLIAQLFTGDRSYLSLTWSGIIWSLIGAVVLVAIMNAISRPRSHTNV